MSPPLTLILIPLLTWLRVGKNTEGSTELSQQAFAKPRIGQNMDGGCSALFMGQEEVLRFFPLGGFRFLKFEDWCPLCIQHMKEVT